MSVELAVLGTVLAVLAAVGFGPAGAQAARRRLHRSRSAPRGPEPVYDPGRERRAERRARELLRMAVGERDYAMFESLGFLPVPGGRGRGADRSGYAYLIYPHRPIVAYDTETGELLSEYCVGFPDREERAYGSRLPGADDVLAKWMSLHGDERGLIADANMHLPGRQLDPDRVRRDLRRLREWEARQVGAVGPGAGGGSRAGAEAA